MEHFYSLKGLVKVLTRPFSLSMETARAGRYHGAEHKGRHRLTERNV